MSQSRERLPPKLRANKTMSTHCIRLYYCNSSKLQTHQMDSSNYIRRQYVQAHHYCRKYIVHSNILRLSEWTLNVPPINLLSFSILSTILVVLQSFVCFFYALLYLVYLFIYLFTLCLCFLNFVLSLFQSIGVAGVCMLCLS